MGRAPSPAFLLLLLRARLFCAGLAVFATEALHASRGIHQLLLAGEKWVTTGADFNVDIAPVGGPGGERIAARALHADLVVCRMNGCLHRISQSFANHLILKDSRRIQQTGFEQVRVRI